MIYKDVNAYLEKKFIINVLYIHTHGEARVHQRIMLVVTVVSLILHVVLAHRYRVILSLHM